MQLSHGIHLAYCTNIHRGETWQQTFDTLQRYTLAVRDRVSRGKPYAIGLRLGDQASRDLSDKTTLLNFLRWLEKENCYVFTINGFPYGKFHGTRVKEQVYAPDWTQVERLDYTCRLFELLARLVPPGIEGSVSTVPGSYKEFITSPDQETVMRTHLWKCIDYVDRLCRGSGKLLHLGLEPEPLCYLETSEEMVRFHQKMATDRPADDRLYRYLGVNYDTCHLAVEFETPHVVLKKFQDHKVLISKIHLSSALKVWATSATRTALRDFADDIYFHQVIAREEGQLVRYRDLDVALNKADETTTKGSHLGDEWRIHFHVPLHSRPSSLFDNTSDHLLGVLDAVGQNPQLCKHFEMETYTWEVMPGELKNRSVVDQLVAEYEWTLRHLASRGITVES